MLDGLRDLWRRVLGEADLRALDGLFARVIWIPDGNLDELDQAAREYRAIVWPPDPPQGDSASDPRPGGERPASATGADQTGNRPAAGSLAEALDHALAAARDGQLEQLDADLDLQQVLKQAAACDTRTPRRGGGTGRTSGRMPDRGVDRPPVADEIAQARRYASRLRRALTTGTRRVDKRTPGGRFDGRAYTRAPSARPDGPSPRTRGRSPGTRRRRSRSRTSV